MTDTSVRPPDVLDRRTARPPDLDFVRTRGDVASVPADEPSTRDDGARRAQVFLPVVAVVALAVAGAVGGSGAVALTAALGLLGVLAYRLADPHLRRWGATEAEVERVPPGLDSADAAHVTTRAVEIDAPTGQVWARLVELGMGSVDWRRRGLLRCGATQRISPVLRGPSAEFEVVRIEAPRLVVGRRADGATWCVELRATTPCRTRLVSRYIEAASSSGDGVTLVDPLRFRSERRWLRAVRGRAEEGGPLLDDPPPQPGIGRGPFAPELRAVRGPLDPARVD